MIPVSSPSVVETSSARVFVLIMMILKVLLGTAQNAK